MAPKPGKLLVIGLVLFALAAPSSVVVQGAVSGTATHASSSSSSTAAVSDSDLGGTVSTAGSSLPSAEPLDETPCSSSGNAFESSSGAALSPDSTASAIAKQDPSAASTTVDSEYMSIVRQATGTGACPALLFPPHAPATAAQVAATQASGVVVPLYSGTPAPMGLADFGVRTDPNGTRVGSVLSTTSVVGAVDANATGIQPLDLYNSEFGPDSYSIQLNAVLNHVVLFGKTGYEFWTQNVVEYFPSAKVLYLVTNVWNFSGNFLLGNAIYEHGPHGAVYGDEVYEAAVVYPDISYPFDLSLYLNSSLTDGRDAVYFTGVLFGPSEKIIAPFDYVVFNSTAPGGSAQSSPAQFVANGTGYDPVGLPNDFELDVGGPGDGSQATLFAADASLGLGYWNATADGGLGGYVSVPAAYSFGSETGETSSGAAVSWSDSPGGPGGLSTYGVMTSGAGILTGLWNDSAPEGAYPVTLDVSPSDAFEVVTPSVQSPWTDLSSTRGAAPPLRTWSAEAYDPKLGVTVLFGGYSPEIGGQLADTWELTSSGQWRELTNLSVSPPGRWAAPMVYDAAIGSLVMFGGRTNAGTGLLNDTWTFNASGWHALDLTHAPKPRGFAEMAYDAASSEIVLYGGGVGTGTTNWKLYRDTWTFQSGAWQNITATAGTAPPGVLKAGMTYNAAASEVLMTGGQINGYQYDECPYALPDLWAFSGGTWSQLSPSGAVPGAGWGSLWFDDATQTTYFYQGISNESDTPEGCSVLTGNVYSFSADHWTLVEGAGAPGAPQPRTATTVVNDGALGRAILFGGELTFDGPFLDDTWAFNANATDHRPTPIVSAEPIVAPTVTSSTLWLTPGNYSLETELSGFAPVTTALNVTGPITVDVDLAGDASLGDYTPIWAWTNAQLGELASSGSGTPIDPYTIRGLTNATLGPQFGLYNDYGFPVYPGVFLLDTTASVDVEGLPQFIAETNDYQEPGPELPQQNSLPIWLWNVTDVAFLDNQLVGYGETVVSELSPFAMVLYDSHDDLLAQNGFYPGVAALLTSFGPTNASRFTGPAGENTIWGNYFNGTYADIGLVEVESHDLIYNNVFNNLVTACSPGDLNATNYCWPFYANNATALTERWNITPELASVVNYAAGFPTIPLTGSIAGTADQGGNLWWNYGIPPNGHGVLPYNMKVYEYYYGLIVYITPGGDYDPLVAQGEVTFLEVGLDAKELAIGWTLTLNGVAYHYTTNQSAAFTLDLGPNMAYVAGPHGYRTDFSGPFNVTTTGSSFIHVGFFRGKTDTLRFAEKGLKPGTHWCLTLDGVPQCSSTPTMKFTGLSPDLTYSANVTRPLSEANISATSGPISVNLSYFELNRSGKVTIDFDWVLTFLPLGLYGDYFVTIDGVTEETYAPGTLAFNLTNGTYHFTVSKIPNEKLIGGRSATVSGNSTRILYFEYIGGGIEPATRETASAATSAYARADPLSSAPLLVGATVGLIGAGLTYRRRK